MMDLNSTPTRCEYLISHIVHVCGRRVSSSEGQPFASFDIRTEQKVVYVLGAIRFW